MSISVHRSTIAYLHIPKISTLGWRKLLLACGVASFVLYVGMDALAALLYDGYSYRSQTISELSAIGAPTRSLWVPLGFVWGVLMVAFGFGVWSSAGGKRALRVVGGLATAMGIVGLAAWPFAPMHQREVLAAGGATFSDTLHLILSGVDMLIFMLSIAFAFSALGKRFRLYSIATVLVVLVFGTLMNLESPQVADNEPTPWIGVTERIMLFGSMLWYAVLAAALWRATDRGPGMVPATKVRGG